MPGFQEVRVRMEDKQVGPFIRFISENIPYAAVVGVEPVKQVLRLPAPDTSDQAAALKKMQTHKPQPVQVGSSKRRMLNVWKRVYDVVKTGRKTYREVVVEAGYVQTPHSAKRVLNTLVKKGFIKGNPEGYEVTTKEFKYGD